MANLFYLRNLADARAAQLRINASITPVREWNSPAGWYLLDDTGTITGSATDAGAATSLAGDDAVTIGGAEAADSTLLLFAPDTLGGSNTYIIDRAYGTGAASGATTGIGGAGGNYEIVLAAGLEITAIIALPGGARVITFGNGAKLNTVAGGTYTFRRGVDGETESMAVFLAEAGFDTATNIFTPTNAAATASPITGRELVVGNTARQARVEIHGVRFYAHEAGGGDATLRFATGNQAGVAETTPGNFVITLQNNVQYNQRAIVDIWNNHFGSRYTDNPFGYAVIAREHAHPFDLEKFDWWPAYWVYEDPAIPGVLPSVYAFGGGGLGADFNIAYDSRDTIASGQIIVDGGVGRIQFGAATDTDHSADGLAQITRGDGNAPFADDSATYAGIHGTLVVLATGDWLYVLNNVIATAAVLNGGSATESFTITISDSITGVHTTHAITINIRPNTPIGGGNTLPVDNSIPGGSTPGNQLPITPDGGGMLTITDAGIRASASLFGVEFRALEAGYAGNGATIGFAAAGAGALLSYVEVTAPGWGAHRVILPPSLLATPVHVADIWNDHYGGRDHANPHFRASVIGGINPANNLVLPPHVGNSLLWDPALWAGHSLTLSGGTDDADMAVAYGTENTGAGGFINVSGGAGGRLLFGAATDTDSSDDNGLVRITPHTALYPDLRMAEYEGRYGTLVVDADGDWVYTLSDDAGDFTGLDGGESDTDAFTITITESATGAHTTHTITVSVLRYDHPPTAMQTVNQVVDEEVSALPLSASDFGYSDRDGDPFTQLRIDSLAGMMGTALMFGGQEVKAGQVMDVVNLRALQFIPRRGDDDYTAQFTYSVSDGKLFSRAPATFTIHVRDNDAILDIENKGARASVVVHGVEFRALDAGSAANAWQLDFFSTGDPANSIARITAAGFSVGISSSTGATQSNVAEIFNSHAGGRNMANTLARARIVETMANIDSAGAWIGDGRGYAFAGGSDAPDFATAENTDSVARGFIAVSDTQGAVVFSVAGGSDTSAGNLTLTGSYGNLVLTPGGDWVYRLNPASMDLRGLAGGQMAIEDFALTITDSATGQSTGHRLAIRVAGSGDIDLEVADDIITDSGRAFVLTGKHIDPGAVRHAGAPILYTLVAESRPGTIEITEDGGKTWEPLPRGAHFDDAALLAGHVRIAAAEAAADFTLHAYSNNNNGAPELGGTGRIITTLRGNADIIAHNPGAVLDAGSGQNAPGTPGGTPPGGNADVPLTITTGLGSNTITPGAGDDIVDAGLGDDVINLGNGGRDVLRYRFALAAGGDFIAIDGSDVITGFTPGEDVLRMVSLHRPDPPTEAVDTAEEVAAALGTGYRAAPDFALIAGRGGNVFSDYNVTGLTLAFPQGVALPGGALSLPSLSVYFDLPMLWQRFADTYLGGFADGSYRDAFDEARAWLKPTAEGRQALRDILGLEVEAGGALRLAYLGTAADDTIAIAAGDSVALAGAGDDTITLNGGADEVVYRLLDDGVALTAVDGNLTIRDFDPGIDSLRFVDTDGMAAAIGDFISRMAGVLLTGNIGAGQYNGMQFIITHAAGNNLPGSGQGAMQSVTVLLDEYLTADAPLIVNLLSGQGDPWNIGTVLNPDPAQFAVVTAPHYIEDFFGDNVEVAATLPAELL